ncbi:uncharacterized protein BXZ73DRAFT_89815 [Epithele typhae]|uniref:uncharacterized protein n=1 Tax=Epithele typhae TaxID=378194 RepID=UPI002008ACBA|nr:uncharacterized protein BXZ73DRAFT_89815 [Epithele typhae]KAH9933167.1 hypothetical protein BXZ73DRAFT_89815 [Epithele typhae]
MSSPTPNASTTPSSPPPPSGSTGGVIYQAETTGNSWSDLKEAFKRLSFGDFDRIGEMPCTRKSLLSGIASGVGIGFVRGMTSGAFVGSNWAVGTFMCISLGTYTICKQNMMEEHKRVQRVIEGIPKRFVKPEDTTGDSSKAA